VLELSLPSFSSVIVVGAGPTGLSVANLLGRMGVNVLVLERNSAPLNIPRAIVLDDEGARTLQAAGVIDTLLPQIVEGDGPIFFDDDGSVLAQVGAGPNEFGYAKRYFINQPGLEEVLKDGLPASGHAQLRFSAEVVSLRNEADHVELAVDHAGARHTLRALIVLACDGARSCIRQGLGIAMEGHTYAEDWLVIDTENDPDQSRNSKAHCRLDRPFLSIPAPAGGRRYEFKLLSGETRQSMATLSSVRRLLEPLRRIEAQDITRMAVYTFEARVAERMREGRVLLLGDAAHLTPPFAGQGMNAGLRDTFNVAWKVAMVMNGAADLSLLDSYELERRQPVKAMIQLAVTMGEIIMPENEADKQLRTALLRKLGDFPGVRDYIFGMKFKPRPRYAAGLFVTDVESEVPGSMVGSMVPQPRLRIGTTSHRLDDLVGPRFSLVVQAADTEAYVLRQRTTLWPELQPVVVSLAPGESIRQLDFVRGKLFDANAAAPIRAHRDQIILVRPDRYAAVAFWPHGSVEAVNAFRALMHGPAMGRAQDCGTVRAAKT
jgi:3-(3-hydroxy-phenyl)propionate hydroxylase